MNHLNLFIIGAPKCGTTAWHEHLSQHSDITFSETKETYFVSAGFPNFRWATHAAAMRLLDLPNNGYSDFRKINAKRKNRSRWLVPSPPASLLSAASFTKKLLGLESLGLASRIRQINEYEKPIHNPISNSVRQQVRQELATNRQLLESFIGYSIDAWPHANQRPLATIAPDTAGRLK